MSLVLGGDANPANARIDGVRQRKVDDAGLTTEKDGRFGPLIGEFHQARPAPSSQHIGLVHGHSPSLVSCHSIP